MQKDCFQIKKKHSQFSRKIVTASSHGKFSRQILTANSRGKFSRQIPTANCHGKFLRQIVTANCQTWITLWKEALTSFLVHIVSSHGFTAKPRNGHSLFHFLFKIVLISHFLKFVRFKTIPCTPRTSPSHQFYRYTLDHLINVCMGWIVGLR